MKRTKRMKGEKGRERTRTCNVEHVRHCPGSFMGPGLGILERCIIRIHAHAVFFAGATGGW